MASCCCWREVVERGMRAHAGDHFKDHSIKQRRDSHMAREAAVVMDRSRDLASLGERLRGRTVGFWLKWPGGLGCVPS